MMTVANKIQKRRRMVGMVSLAAAAVAAAHMHGWVGLWSYGEVVF